MGSFRSRSALASTVSAFVGRFRGLAVGFGGGVLSVCPVSFFRPLPRWWFAQAILAVRATLRNSQERAAADDDNDDGNDDDNDDDDDDDDGDDANGSYREIRHPPPPPTPSVLFFLAL